MTGLHSRSLNTAITLMFMYRPSFKVPPTSHSCGMAYHSTAATEAAKEQQQMKKKNDIGFTRNVEATSALLFVVLWFYALSHQAK